MCYLQAATAAGSDKGWIRVDQVFINSFLLLKLYRVKYEFDSIERRVHMQQEKIIKLGEKPGAVNFRWETQTITGIAPTMASDHQLIVCSRNDGISVRLHGSFPASAFG